MSDGRAVDPLNAAGAQWLVADPVAVLAGYAGSASATLGWSPAGSSGRRLGTVSVSAVDEYLQGLAEPKRSTLEALRTTILELVPEAEQAISYGVPAFQVGGGKTFAGFAAFRSHLSYLPFSGSVLPSLAGELDGYTRTKSALHFPIDQPLPKALVKKLIAGRLSEIGVYESTP